MSVFFLLLILAAAAAVSLPTVPHCLPSMPSHNLSLLLLLFLFFHFVSAAYVADILVSQDQLHQQQQQKKMGAAQD